MGTGHVSKTPKSGRPDFERLLYYGKKVRNLSTAVKELLDNDLNLFKEDWVKCGRHFVADQFFDVFLNLRAKFFVRTDEQAQQLTEELSDWAILDVLAGAVRQNPGIESATKVYFKEEYILHIIL